MTNGSHKGPQPIIVECEFDKPPETVWRALTVPEVVAAWLGENDIKPQIGARFRVSAGRSEPAQAECKILAAEPPNLIRYSWRTGQYESVVTFELAETEAGGTRLRLVHGDFVEVAARLPTASGVTRSAPLAPERPRRARRFASTTSAFLRPYRPLRAAA